MFKTTYRVVGNRNGYPYPIGGIFDCISEAVHYAANYAKIEANKNANCAVHRINTPDSARINCFYPFTSCPLDIIDDLSSVEVSRIYPFASCVFKIINESANNVVLEIFVYPINEQESIYNNHIFKYRGIEIRIVSEGFSQRFDIYIMNCFICFATTINEALMFIDAYRNTRLSC